MIRRKHRLRQFRPEEANQLDMEVGNLFDHKAEYSAHRLSSASRTIAFTYPVIETGQRWVSANGSSNLVVTITPTERYRDIHAAFANVENQRVYAVVTAIQPSASQIQITLGGVSESVTFSAHTTASLRLSYAIFGYG